MANDNVVYDRGPHANLDPGILAELSETRGPWYETREEVKAGLDWGERKAELMRWVRREMGRRLTLRERRLIELHYFNALSIAATAKKEGVCLSTVTRGLHRAIQKLRRAADKAALRDDPRFSRRGKASSSIRF